MSRSDFTTVRVVGGLLPTDLLARVLAGDKDLGGLTSSDYHLPSGENPREAANRAWSYLLGAWHAYRQALAKLPEGDPAVGLTREKWLTVLFKELDYGRLQQTPAGGIIIDDKAFPVSHLWGATPLHLLGWGVDLDKRTKAVPGAADRAPQAMVQELLNRTDDYLWAMLSNGRTIRLLRDSTSLAGQAYVEFDLESMFDGEVFSDFVLLYLLLHQSRVEVPTDGIPSDCWLEKWRSSAAETGTRALGLLRDGVKDALEALGTGFLQAQGNDLNQRIADGELKLEDYHRSLLRLVYRLLFLFVTEDRGLLLAPDADQTAVSRFYDYYSTARLRSLVRKRRGARHTDQWDGLQLVIEALGKNEGLPQLGLPGLGGIFNPEPIDVVMGQHLPNQALFTAIRKLSIVHPKSSPPRIVDYRNLGAEELGSIYESLLELVPRHDQLERTFTLANLAGNERKTSGSYYTPSSLIDLVLDEALNPLLDEREKDKNPEQALLEMTVCDPACGSGHFLVAAARRIATRLASVRTGEADPTPTDIQTAMHDVVARCIYGVDLNPMAAELAKVSLWLEAMQPGKPLSFLDAHIKVGNALLGTTPRLIADGLPDAAFDPIAGDDKKFAASLKRRNRAEREQSAGAHRQGGLFDEATIDVTNEHLRSRYSEVIDKSLQASDLTQIAAAVKRYREADTAPEVRRSRLVADTWCAAFVQRRHPGVMAITQGTVEQAASGQLSTTMEAEIDNLASRYGFFHWHLEFPEVFLVTGSSPENSETGWNGGFTALLGNPPWDQIQLDPREFFASRDPAIAEAPNMAKRNRMIDALSRTNPALVDEFTAAQRLNDSVKAFVHASGRYPLTSYGRLNTYSLFAEASSTLVTASGLAGLITPTGLLTDAFNQHFASMLTHQQRLVAFYDFENEARLFPSVHHAFRFAVSCWSGGRAVPSSRLAFVVRHVPDVATRRFMLSADDILLMNPNAGTLPVFATRRDAEVTQRIYRLHQVLIRDGDLDVNPWGLKFSIMFMMNTGSQHFRTAAELADLGAIFNGWSWEKESQHWVPLYEAKMLNHWDHRYSTYKNATEAQLRMQTLPRLNPVEHDDPNVEPLSRYWVDEREVEAAIGDKSDSGWLLGWRDVTGAEKWRTFIPTVWPRGGSGGSWCAYPESAEHASLLLTIWSSMVWDYVCRQKISGTHMTLFIAKQLPIPQPELFAKNPPWLKTSLGGWIAPRLLELVFTSYRVAAFAEDLGETNLPFRWIPERREAIRAELDAAMMHVYGLERDEVEHVLDSFFVLRRHEERDHGEFRTKRLVLAEYDRMAEAAATGVPFVSSLDPAPGHGPRHDASTIPDWFKEKA